MTIRIEEKSLQLALLKAAGQLGITQDELGYKVVEQNKGFLGMFGKKVAIEVWKKKPRNNSGRKSPTSQTKQSSFHEKKSFDNSEKTPLSKKDINELKESLRDFCEGICTKMVGEKVEVTGELDNDRLVLNIENDYLAGQLQKNGRFAEALEHLLRKKPRHIRQELPFRLFVDVNGVRRSRENELVDMARDLSDKVNDNKKPIVLNYKSSYDRKIIHMALDRDKRVFTKSIGSGANRKLMILPSKDQRQARRGH